MQIYYFSAFAKRGQPDRAGGSGALTRGATAQASSIGTAGARTATLDMTGSPYAERRVSGKEDLHEGGGDYS